PCETAYVIPPHMAVVVVRVHNIPVIPKPVPAVLFDLLIVIVYIKGQLCFYRLFACTLGRRCGKGTAKNTACFIIRWTTYQQWMILYIFHPIGQFRMCGCMIQGADL